MRFSNRSSANPRLRTLAAVAAALFVGPSLAATFTVDSLGDSVDVNPGDGVKDGVSNADTFQFAVAAAPVPPFRSGRRRCSRECSAYSTFSRNPCVALDAPPSPAPSAPFATPQGGIREGCV